MSQHDCEQSHLLRGECCQWSSQLQAPQPFPGSVPFPLPQGGGDQWPPKHPAVQPQPKPWKDSRGLGPIRLPTLRLIPLTLCLTAPYLACQRSGDPQPLCPVPAGSKAHLQTVHAIQSRWWMGWGWGGECIDRKPDFVLGAHWKATKETSLRYLKLTVVLLRELCWMVLVVFTANGR